MQPGLRWPGYLGDSYRPGGLLSVGNVHTDFDTAGLRGAPEVPVATASHLAWSRGECADDEWIQALRAMYRAGLSWPGGWTVAKHHVFYWKGLGESVDTIAYVNAARCQWPGKGPAQRVIEECVAQLPLTTLVDVLQPRLVLSSSLAAYDQLASIVPSLYVHQLNGRNLRSAVLHGASSVATVGEGGRHDTVKALHRAGFARS